MDESTKIALGIVGAAFVLLFGYVAYSEFQRARDIDQVRQAFAGIAQVGQQAVQQSQADAYAQQQRLAAQWTEDARRRLLASDQRCVGGEVFQVHGSSFTQIGTMAYPVHCSGNMADRPIR